MLWAAQLGKDCNWEPETTIIKLAGVVLIISLVIAGTWRGMVTKLNNFLVSLVGSIGGIVGKYGQDTISKKNELFQVHLFYK